MNNLLQQKYNLVYSGDSAKADTFFTERMEQPSLLPNVLQTESEILVLSVNWNFNLLNTSDDPISNGLI